MTDKEKIEFIIRHLGFRGACATLRVSKAKMIQMRIGDHPFSKSHTRYATKTIHAIHNILQNKPALKYVEVYYYYHQGITLEEIRASDKKISIYTLNYITPTPTSSIRV